MYTTDWQKVSARCMKDKELEPRTYMNSSGGGGGRGDKQTRKENGHITPEETLTVCKQVQRGSTSVALQVGTMLCWPPGGQEGERTATAGHMWDRGACMFCRNWRQPALLLWTVLRCGSAQFSSRAAVRSVSSALSYLLYSRCHCA